jgi:hypothetical protein
MGAEEVAMAKVRRNGPCPCGSGQKAKRCCHGIESDFDNKLIAPDLCAQAFLDLAGVSQLEMRALFQQLLFLPELDLSLQVQLPPLHTPELHRAIAALQDDDPNTFDDELLHVVAGIDDADRRRALADAVIALRERGHVDKRLAALAIVELDRETSTFFISSVAESIAVLAGDQHTPSGLLVAAS